MLQEGTEKEKSIVPGFFAKACCEQEETLSRTQETREKNISRWLKFGF